MQRYFRNEIDNMQQKYPKGYDILDEYINVGREVYFSKIRMVNYDVLNELEQIYLEYDAIENKGEFVKPIVYDIGEVSIYLRYGYMMYPDNRNFEYNGIEGFKFAIKDLDMLVKIKKECPFKNYINKIINNIIKKCFA